LAYRWDPFVIGRLTWRQMIDWRDRAASLGPL
jgi:hypothetical protein